MSVRPYRDIIRRKSKCKKFFGTFDDLWKFKRCLCRELTNLFQKNSGFFLSMTQEPVTFPGSCPDSCSKRKISRRSTSFF